MDDAGNILMVGLVWPLLFTGDEEAMLTPRMVRRMLMHRSPPHPRSRKTPRGGRRTAKMILQMSLPRTSALGVTRAGMARSYLAVKAIMTECVLVER